jgi:hypothetical protein
MRRVAVLAGAVGLSMVGLAPPAFAPHVAQIQVKPAQVRPGDRVTVYGPNGYGNNPVSVRFNSAEGPVLGTFPTDQTGYSAWGPGEVTIPADVEPGRYFLFATQELLPAETHIRGVPAKSEITVVGPYGAPVVAEPSPGAAVAGADGPRVGVLENEGVSGGRLALVALGVLGGALFVAGAVALAAGQRGRAAGRAAPTP